MMPDVVALDSASNHFQCLYVTVAVLGRRWAVAVVFVEVPHTSTSLLYDLTTYWCCGCLGISYLMDALAVEFSPRISAKLRGAASHELLSVWSLSICIFWCMCGSSSREAEFCLFRRVGCRGWPSRRAGIASRARTPGNTRRDPRRAPGCPRWSASPPSRT